MKHSSRMRTTHLSEDGWGADQAAGAVQGKRAAGKGGEWRCCLGKGAVQVEGAVWDWEDAVGGGQGCCAGVVGLPWGKVLSRGVSVVFGGGAAHNRKWYHNTSFLTEWMTDMCKTLSCPILHLLAVKIKLDVGISPINFNSTYYCNLKITFKRDSTVVIF